MTKPFGNADVIYILINGTFRVEEVESIFTQGNLVVINDYYTLPKDKDYYSEPNRILTTDVFKIEGDLLAIKDRITEQYDKARQQYEDMNLAFGNIEYMRKENNR